MCVCAHTAGSIYCRLWETSTGRMKMKEEWPRVHTDGDWSDAARSADLAGFVAN